jgi:hypothetical protein
LPLKNKRPDHSAFAVYNINNSDFIGTLSSFLGFLGEKTAKKGDFSG